ncbi:hypothetical protein ACCQ41_01365 [Anaerococcus sp. ENR0831]|uniref:PTS EIIB type-2 domain-containing protein n=2 Tax=Anaerococcus martiniensis TaxID=3115615 RepID=A0ABW9M676_9FIRM
MAQEGLEEAARKDGVDIKVETNGSDGIKNRLNEEDIKRAKAVIITADKKVETARFDGKKVIQRPVSDGIRKADELVERAIKGDANIFHSENKANENYEKSSDDSQSLWQRVNGDVMNGISHMLPFVIGGGILLEISFLFERFMGDSSSSFSFYAFAIGVFTDTGIGSYMAAVMFGGMVPPIAIDISCSLFKNKFTEKETKITNFILGLSFITEGAIPFAASEPQTVIPSVAIGSAISGVLVGAFDVQSPAPHGGVFVLPAMGSLNQAFFFLLAVAVGSIIGALILGNLKKKPEEKYDNIYKKRFIINLFLYLNFKIEYPINISIV